MKALVLGAALVAGSARADEAVPAVPAPLALPRIPAGGITLDGELSDPAWQEAARIETCSCRSISRSTLRGA